MATDTVITLPRRPKTGAERQRAYKARLKVAKASEAAQLQAVVPNPVAATQFPPEPVTGSGSGNSTPVTLDVTPAPTAGKGVRGVPLFGAPNLQVSERFSPARLALRAAGLGLALVGLSMNAVYARSLGSSDLSGWLFLALGLCADCAALTLPSVSASCQDIGSKAAAWVTWATMLAFAVLGSVGFASTSISDVTLARSSRVTTQVVTAQSALADAMKARDLECKGGVGRFCRERETAVETSRAGLAAAMGAVQTGADPQAAAMMHLVTWASAGHVTPTEGDVSMVRLLLVALLPQVGGILLMVSRQS
ncbi:hypothetical protein [Bradyrhizobium oligotrophicum]|uniref:hypothetical protein n=1 Tax=Bradyrhizobium oligotrophicum TaxID=44255 RepID=UPI003EB7F8A2